MVTLLIKFLSPRILLLGCMIGLSLPAMSGERETVLLENGNEIDIEKYPSDGDNLVLWLPSDHGLTTGLKHLASELAKRGVEVWIADPFSTWFLNTTPDSLEKIEQEDYLQLIHKAITSDKNITLASNDKGTSVLLEIARKWQLKNTGNPLTGSIIISPNPYVETPGSGEEAKYLPVVQVTNLNMLLLVPKKSTAFLRLEALQDTLTKAGSTVYLQPLPDVRDRFFFREDATDIEQETSAALARKIKSGIHLLQQTPTPTPNQEAVTVLLAQVKTSSAPATGRILPFRGNWEPPQFTLFDLEGFEYTLENHLGKVLLVNFWASWCPPCIHEIPSMTRLQNSFVNSDFKIIAINLGEDRASIETFLQQHPVNFSVLLDPGQTQPKQWKVFAFPTSYLLDRKGRIRYSVAGGINWNDSEVKQKISSLLNEKQESEQPRL